MIQIIKVQEAVGRPLAHDITEIRPGKIKGPVFKRGHVIRDNDIHHLLRLGKDHICILDKSSRMQHEDEAARTLAPALCGEGVYWKDSPAEGKIRLFAKYGGVLKVDIDALLRINVLGDIMCATRHTDSVVEKNQQIAATRAIPLVIDRTTVNDAVRIAEDCGGILKVCGMRAAQAGVMITGNEIYHGRIEDKFEPIIRKKVAHFKGRVMDVVILPDDDDRIAEAALALIGRGADVLITTGGMSVDPDDRTRFGMQKAGARDLLYGAAVLPGAMFMVARLKDVPVLGIPACGLHAGATVFDLIYPRVLCGETITRESIARLGHGGMCLKCGVCVFPDCPFGKN